jgi:hypothetical protein
MDRSRNAAPRSLAAKVIGPCPEGLAATWSRAMCGYGAWLSRLRRRCLLIAGRCCAPLSSLLRRGLSGVLSLGVFAGEPAQNVLCLNIDESRGKLLCVAEQ